ncbi:MAG: hypothetical protein EPN94_03500 [Nitrospirae bacterium]|nr:MAG: hypothetical protein EPN94_03500 [Nitrospirota bacterium]
MKWWTDSMQRSYQMLIGFHMNDAIKAGQDFKTMDPHFSRMLDRYGIREAEWNIIKQAKGVDIMGNEMITPVSIKMLGDAPAIRETAVKVAAMMHEEANTAIVTPGARQYSWINEKAPAGTKTGELIRSLALFHNFTLALTQKVFPRVFGVEGTAGFRAGTAAQFALGMIITGGIAYQLKEISKGRNPRDITEPKFWLSATMQSGGFGIFGDFLYSDVQKFGGGLMSTAGGPVLGLVDDFKKLTFDNIWAAARGEDTHIGAEAIQFVKNYTPYINLFYIRAALDHLLFFTVQEAANPGYLRRMRSRAQNQNNQTFWWDPQDTLPEEAPNLGAMVGEK